MSTQKRGYIAAVGGGAEVDAPGSWSERPYRWIVERAEGRPVAVLSTTDEGDFLPRYFTALGAPRSFNLKIDSRAAANSAAVSEAISSAGAVFVKGGSQWEYIRIWSGTKTERAIAELFASGGVVAGTSAGMHVLGRVIYDARDGSVYPEEALRDPYDPRISFTIGALGLLPDVCFDSHFTERGRIARLAVFVARLEAEQGGSGVLGIGVDDRTALVVEPNGRAEVMGVGSATFVRAGPETRIEVAPGRAPGAIDLALDMLTEGFVFDLAERRVVEAPPSARTNFPPRPPADYVPAAIDGSSKKDGRAGEVTLRGATKREDALDLGRLKAKEGERRFGNATVVTRAFADVEYIENRVGGLLWLLARTPGISGLLLDAGAVGRLDGGGRLEMERIAEAPSALLVDCREVRWVDFSRWTVSDRAKGPRQSVALTNVRLHLLPGGWAWDSQG